MRYYNASFLFAEEMMMLAQKLTEEGEHPFSINGPAGLIEGVLSVPKEAHQHYLALLGHPHSLQGGTMNNKVVTTLAKLFNHLGVPCVRFNFRGVGASAGDYDGGVGESEDLLFLAHALQQQSETRQLLLAGFSFGSYVVYRAAAQQCPALLITIAPPVHHYDYHEFTLPHSLPWVIVQGDKDEVVPPALVYQFANGFNPPLPIVHFVNTGHFFHGQLVALKSRLAPLIKEKVKGL